LDQNTDTLASLTNLGWILAGLLLALGTKLAGDGGALSFGHVYCSAPLMDKRSVLAGLISILSAFLVATFRHYVPFMVRGLYDA